MDQHDPRLTAYVLNELEQAERAEVEAGLAASAELREELASLREAVDVIGQALAATPCPHLHPAQRESIAARADLARATAQSVVGSRPGRRRLWLAAAAGIAATILIAGLLSIERLPWRQSAQTSGTAEPAVESMSGSATESRTAPVSDLSASSAPQGDPGLPAGAPADSLESRPQGPATTDFSGRDDGYLQILSGEQPAAQEPPPGVPAEPAPAGVERFRRIRPDGTDADDLYDFNAEPRPDLLAPGILTGSEEDVREFDSGQQPAGAAPSDPMTQPSTGYGAYGGSPGAGGYGSEGFGDSSGDSGQLRGGEASERFSGGAGGMQGRSPQSAVELDIRQRGDAGGQSFPDPAQPLPALAEMQSRLESERARFNQPGEASIEELGEQARLIRELATPVVNPESSGEPGSTTPPENASEQPAREPSPEEPPAADKPQIATKADPPRTWRRARATPNASRVMVGDNQDLPLEGVQVTATIDGFRARVLLDVYHYNPHDRQLEGTFQLRLPDEASLYYFAFGPTAFEYRPAVDSLAAHGFLTPELVRSSGTGPEEILRARSDSWRDVKQARVVPREKAAFAYSEVVRRRVDPALVEWSGAGVFQARVFPLAPRQLHRIVIGYDVNLRQDGPDLVYRLALPEDVSQCMVDIDVSALPGLTAQVTPQVRPFVSGGRAFYHYQDFPDKQIEVRLQDPGTLLLSGQDEAGQDYFAARFTPDLPADAGRSGASRAVFLVDTSLSSNPEKFNVWLDLLQAVLEQNRDQIREFAVLFFNVEAHWWRTRYEKNTPDNVRQVLADASQLALEGATDLRQALAEASAPQWLKPSETPPPDLFLLSDGAATWGETDVRRIAGALPEGSGTLFAYKTGLTGTAIEMLEQLARERGGAVFSVADEQELVAAATAHRQRPWRLLNVAYDGAADVLVAGRPNYVYPGQSLLIAGRGPAQAVLRLHARRGDEDRVLTVAFDRQVTSELVPRTYGQIAVGQLEDLGADVEQIAVAYARHFRVPARTCSLLMLESEADYERFAIKPEDDRFVVGSRPADELVRQKLDELAQTLADPKQSLQAWLDRLAAAPGLEFRPPTALTLMIEGLPPEAFEVPLPRLVCELRRREEIDKKYFEQLSAAQLDYEAVQSEAHQRRSRYGAADAVKCLSSLVENSPGEIGLTLDAAFVAVDCDLPGQAYPLLRRAAEARPYLPSLYLAMADCLAQLERADLAMICYEIALNASWHGRYGDVSQIATVQYLHLLQRVVGEELPSSALPYARSRLASLSQSTRSTTTALAVMMLWNTDRTDVDLHVQEPSGEVCYYQNRDTRGGGHLTTDVTEGFGPEMYTLPRAAAGTYRIFAHYYSTDANRAGARTKVYLTVYRMVGQTAEQVTRHAVTLTNQQDKQELATIDLLPPPKP